jgi:uncharacterized protein (DUF1684 family)
MVGRLGRQLLAAWEARGVHDPSAAVTLVDWRRRVFAMYAEVRAMDAEAGHAHWQNARNELFASHPQSPLSPKRKATFQGLPVASYDASLRYECAIADAAPEHRDVPTGTDGVVSFDRIGRVQLGDVGSLDVWEIVGYGGGLFVPLKDATAGKTSYGGGRYLLDTRKGADLGGDPDKGTLVIDLNFAYHPSCAYDPAWVCPLAPAGNMLAVPTRVGELYPAG